MTDPVYPEPNIDFEEVAEFFKQKGAIELIAFLNNEGHTFEELNNNLDISRSYVNDRIGEAAGLGFAKANIGHRDGDQVKIWMISPNGQYFQRKMRELGLENAHERFINARLELESKKNEFQGWVQSTDDVEEEITEIYQRKFELQTESYTITEENISEDETIDDSDVDIPSDYDIKPHKSDEGGKQ